MLRRIAIQCTLRFCTMQLRQSQNQSNRILRISPAFCTKINFVRWKTVMSGTQGLDREEKSKAAKKNSEDDAKQAEDGVLSEDNLLDLDYESLAADAMHIQKGIRIEENVLIIQPFIKWGTEKSEISPEIKLQEAEDLVRSLETWHVRESIIVPLASVAKTTVFGNGKIKELRILSRKYNGDAQKKITCIFVSINMLSQPQKEHLELAFGLPVIDRFSVIIQILRMHAISREAKLQISLAEIPYIWRQMGKKRPKRGKLNDSQKMVLRNREKKIKIELEHVCNHRQMIRARRLRKQFPIVAIVGYTNAGKTSLIKALTNQEKLQPKDQLFATLDITAHAGVLPCNLRVIYIDTIGFMSDVPTELIECFNATLEDAMMADLIILVHDVAHVNSADQRKHVEQTLSGLLRDSDTEKHKLLTNIINVGNKCDLVTDLAEIKSTFNDSTKENKTAERMHFISSTKMSGISELKHAIERNILKITNRKKIIIRVPQSGDELQWLYQNTAVTFAEADPKNCEYLLVHVLLTDLALMQFKNTFLKKP